MNFKWRYILYGFLLGIVPPLIIFIIYSRSCDTIRATSLGDSVGIYTRNITSLTLPTRITLFGKPVPIDKSEELRERFEREFYYNYANPDQLILWWKRLGRWGHFIDSSLDANGLDRDLKYLMVAESGIRNVQSPAKANGFWQFIPPTGIQWGLRVDDEIDERLDPMKSTAAAIRYLTKLKAEFGGDYVLAAAAYNMSEGNLELALAHQGQQSYWNLYLSEETMRYIFRIAAIKELLEHGASYGLRFENMVTYDPWDVRYVRVAGPVESIYDWAKTNNSSYKDVKIYNQWIVGHSLPSGDFLVALPADSSGQTTIR